MAGSATVCTPPLVGLVLDRLMRTEDGLMVPGLVQSFANDQAGVPHAPMCSIVEGVRFLYSYIVLARHEKEGT